MQIQNSVWKTIAEENQQGGLTFGYEAPASTSLLQKLQQDQIWIEVVGQNSSPRLIRPDNPDSQIFTPDQKFRIMEKNKAFAGFEKKLTIACGGKLPDNRFDEFVNWTNPNAYGKRGAGLSKTYFLSLDHLSDDKKQELKENLKECSPQTKANKILISGQKNIDLLEFTWKMAQSQGGLKRFFQKPVLKTKPLMPHRRGKDY